MDVIGICSIIIALCVLIVTIISMLLSIRPIVVLSLIVDEFDDGAISSPRVLYLKVQNVGNRTADNIKLLENNLPWGEVAKSKTYFKNFNSHFYQLVPNETRTIPITDLNNNLINKEPFDYSAFIKYESHKYPKRNYNKDNKTRKCKRTFRDSFKFCIFEHLR